MEMSGYLKFQPHYSREKNLNKMLGRQQSPSSCGDEKK
jgi:hypothetical protein